MFKKLKTRLSLLNLAIAGIILVSISVMSYILISGNIKQQSLQSFQMVLSNLASNQQNIAKPQKTLSMMMKGQDSALTPVYPYYIIGINTDNATYSAPDSPLPAGIVNQIIQNVLQNGTQIQNKLSMPVSSGSTAKEISIINPEANLNQDGQSYRYGAVYGSDGGITIVIQDRSSEAKLLTNIGLILVLCVAGGLVLLFFGGRYLAERSIRPIRESWMKQREFVADASHELRTPLAAIISNIDVVMDDPGATVQEKQLYCQGIAEESKRMTQLVDGLLVLARADSDALVFQTETVDIAQLAQNAAAFMQPGAAKKDIAINLQIKNKPVAAGDPARLKQVLIQLLDNAVKYTPAGGKIAISVDQIKDKAVLKVADNGIGIPKTHLPHIFERFYRVDVSREREVGGHGLGLSIARFIVEQHGGTISAASEQGTGSVFTIQLPAK